MALRRRAGTARRTVADTRAALLPAVLLAVVLPAVAAGESPAGTTTREPGPAETRTVSSASGELRVFVRAFAFTGNKAFTADELRAVVKSFEERTLAHRGSPRGSPAAQRVLPRARLRQLGRADPRPGNRERRRRDPRGRGHAHGRGDPRDAGTRPRLRARQDHPRGWERPQRQRDAGAAAAPAPEPADRASAGGAAPGPRIGGKRAGSPGRGSPAFPRERDARERSVAERRRGRRVAAAARPQLERPRRHAARRRGEDARPR